MSDRNRNRNPWNVRLAPTRVSVATAYSFRAVDDLGWAHATVNDATGELSVTSDWGNWAHVWGTNHLGCPTLHDALGGRFGIEYIAGKLCHHTTAFDADATVAEFRRQICDRRRSGALDARAARAIWEELGSLAANVDDGSEASAALFLERLYRIDDIGLLRLEGSEDLRYRDSHEYNALVAWIVPAIRVACAKTVALRAAADQTVTGDAAAAR